MTSIPKILEHPLCKRLVPLLYGMTAAMLIIWLGGNTWIEATTPVAAMILLATAILGGYVTRRDGLTNPIAWFIEMLPAANVLLFANHVGLSCNADRSVCTPDHMGRIAVWLGVIIVSPFVGGVVRYITSHFRD